MCKDSEPKVVGYDGKDFEYCPYNETSKAYDETRAPVGLDIAFGNFALNDKPLHEQALLDVGCGTGTFLKVAQRKFGAVTGLEYNDGMLAQARQVVPDVKLVQGSADQLPFPDQSFDAVTINQVVHHFPSDNNYAFLEKAVQEVARVLRPGGCVVVSTSAPDQQENGFWWISLFPKSREAVCKRFPPIPTFCQFFRAAGLSIDDNGVSRPARSLMAEQAYLNKFGRDVLAMAKDAQYRAGDSSWAMAEAQGELPEGIAKLEAMSPTEREAWLEEREALRKQCGQATFLCARK